MLHLHLIVVSKETLQQDKVVKDDFLHSVENKKVFFPVSDGDGNSCDVTVNYVNDIVIVPQ